VFGLSLGIGPARGDSPAGAQEGTGKRPETAFVRYASSATAPLGPKADGGDDQIGLVGRQITLNGSRSQPREKVGFRWIQLSGPTPAAAAQDHAFFSFTPKQSGAYRFALVVALDSMISEPDVVEVLVGTLDAPSAATGSAPAAPPSLEDYLKATMTTLPSGPESIEPLAKLFEELAGRMELYSSYSEVYSELSRRLEKITPRDPASRAAWIQKLFSPLTLAMIEQLRSVGLDLARAETSGQAFSTAQRTRLAEYYHQVGSGLRAALPVK
jgi:hypothetical protein